MVDGVQAQTGDLECAVTAGTAEQRLQSSGELDERERFGEVVVAAGVEAGDPVDERVSSGEEEDGRLDAARA